MIVKNETFADLDRAPPDSGLEPAGPVAGEGRERLVRQAAVAGGKQLHTSDRHQRTGNVASGHI